MPGRAGAAGGFHGGEGVQRVQAGALDARVGTVASADEIGRLAVHLDQLLGTIDDNTRELRRWLWPHTFKNPLDAAGFEAEVGLPAASSV